LAGLRVAPKPVGSYPTISPLPTETGGMFLCHFPSGCPAWELPSALPVWSSDLPLAKGERSPGLLKPNKCNIPLQ